MVVVVVSNAINAAIVVVECIQGRVLSRRSTAGEDDAARLHRSTLCYSKSRRMLEDSIRLLLHYLKFRTIDAIVSILPYSATPNGVARRLCESKAPPTLFSAKV
jgi:hypothetical protein